VRDGARVAEVPGFLWLGSNPTRRSWRRKGKMSSLGCRQKQANLQPNDNLGSQHSCHEVGRNVRRPSQRGLEAMPD